jgi:uridylate kinase
VCVSVGLNPYDRYRDDLAKAGTAILTAISNLLFSGRCIMTQTGSQPRRVLLKLSGEAFGGGKVGIDTAVIRRIASEVTKAVQKGTQVAIVVGGGNFFRGAELQEAGLDRSRGDYMGMLGTVMNCLALQDFLEQEGQETRVQTAIEMRQVAEPYIPLRAIHHLNRGRVVIFGAGSGMPFFSTDTVSIQRALEIHCQEVMMGKNGVDGVYTSDPHRDPSARKFKVLSFKQALVDNLAVMDSSALSMARDNHLNIRVFGLEKPGNVTRVLTGEHIGTLVTTCDQSSFAD